MFKVVMLGEVRPLVRMIDSIADEIISLSDYSAVFTTAVLDIKPPIHISVRVDRMIDARDEIVLN